MAAASPSTSDAAERLARLVQRLRRLVRGELILTDGHTRLQPQDETDVATALELAREQSEKMSVCLPAECFVFHFQKEIS